MTLRCIARYLSRIYAYEPGQIIRDLSPSEEAWLLCDSPGSFEVVSDEQARALDEPPAHRAILEAPATRDEDAPRTETRRRRRG